MLHLLLSIIGIIITILFVIGTHEAGHFLTARLVGVKVLRFSIGFGKTLFHFYDKSGTEYVFALIPLGGYVKMLDENEEAVPESELPYAYNRQPFYKKFLIVLAGPLVNIFCAFSLYWLIFVIGFVTVKPVIGTVTPRSIAAEAGLSTNQEITHIDNDKTSNWTGIMFRLLAHAGNKDFATITVTEPNSQTSSTHTLNLSNWQLDGLTPDPLASLGITPYEPVVPLVIGFITTDSPAATSPLQKGDTIVAVNQTPIKNWEALMTVIYNHPQQTLTFHILRAGKPLSIPVTIGYKRAALWHKAGYLGISPSFEWPKNLLQKIQYDPFTALTQAGKEIYDFTYFNLLLIGKMITGKISLESLGGPVTIFESAGNALNYGFLAFISFLAFLSISIGVINLLPIPGLDGGHLFLQMIEAIFRRPVPEKVLLNLYRVGFFIILFFLFQALINDILRIFTVLA